MLLKYTFKLLKIGLILTLFTNCSPQLKQSFKNLSKPERTWAVFHPFKAKKAYPVSREAIITADSIAKGKVIGNDINGGKLDAFKHSFWMARTAQRIGKNAALNLGKAHEKGNYETFKKRQLEDGILPDRPASDMDLFNNMMGAEIGKKYKRQSKIIIIKHVLDSIEHGKLRMLKKDNLGNFLNCEGEVISVDSLKGKWDNDKCLVPTN